MSPEIHFAVCTISKDGEGIRSYKALCAVKEKVLDHHWTINPDLVTCRTCKQRAPVVQR